MPSGTAITTTNNVVDYASTQTITGAKTFSSTITGSVSGNAGTVTDGVYLSSSQTITGAKTFSSQITANGGVNAGSATIQTTGSVSAATVSAPTFTGATGTFDTLVVKRIILKPE